MDDSHSFICVFSIAEMDRSSLYISKHFYLSLFYKQIRIFFPIFDVKKKKMFQFSTWQMLKNISAKILSYFSRWPENSIFQIKFGTLSCSLIINDFIMRLYNQPMYILSLSMNSLWKKSICTKLSNKVILTSQTNKNQTCDICLTRSVFHNILKKLIIFYPLMIESITKYADFDI